MLSLKGKKRIGIPKGMARKVKGKESKRKGKNWKGRKWTEEQCRAK